MNSSFRVPLKPAARAPEYQRQQAYPVPGLNANARLSDSAAGIARQTIAAQQDFTDQQAKQLDALGKNVTKAAETAYNLYTDYETSKAKDAYLQYRQAAAKKQAELDTGLQGKDAMDEKTGVQAQMSAWREQARAEAAQRTGGGIAGNLFERAAAAVDADMDVWATQKVHRAAVDYGNATSKANIALKQNEALALAGDPFEFGKRMGVIKAEYEAMAKRSGYGAEWVEASLQDVRQKTLIQAISDAIAGEQLGNANAMLKAYGSQLGGAAEGLRARVSAKGRELQARARAERAERQFDVHVRLQDSIAAWRQGQDAPTAPTQKEVVSAYGAEKGQRIWQEVESARAFGADIQAMSTLTPEEQARMLADRKPQPGDGYASSLADYTRLEHAVKVDQELRQKDPIGYLLGKDKGVQTAFKAWQESPTPENAQIYATQIQAAGAARGMRQSEVESPPLLPDNAAKDLAWRIANSDKPAEMLEQQQAAWGQHWPSVERQLVTGGKMPTGLRVVASGMDKESGGLLAATYRNPKYMEQAKDALGLTDTSFKDIRGYVHGELEQFTATLQAQGDIEMAATITDSATRLTLEYMQRGFDAKDAARKASEDVALNRYSLIEQGDGYYRVPANVDADAIAKGARSALLGIASKPESLSVPKASGGLTSQFVAQSASSIIRREGEWVTAPDESGLNLYVHGRPVRDAQGNIIFRSWADMERAGNEGKRYQRPAIEDIMDEYGIGGYK